MEILEIEIWKVLKLYDKIVYVNLPNIITEISVCLKHI